MMASRPPLQASVLSAPPPPSAPQPRPAGQQQAGRVYQPRTQDLPEGYSQKLAKEQQYGRLHTTNPSDDPETSRGPPPPSYTMATTPTPTSATGSTLTTPGAAPNPASSLAPASGGGRTRGLRHTRPTYARERDRDRDDASSDTSFWENAAAEADRLQFGTRGGGGGAGGATYAGPAYPQHQQRTEDEDVFGPVAPAVGGQAPIYAHPAYYGSPSAPPPPSAYRAPSVPQPTTQRPLPSPPGSVSSHGGGTSPRSGYDSAQSQLPQQQTLQHTQHQHGHPSAPEGPRHLGHVVPGARHLPPEELDRELPSIPSRTSSPGMLPNNYPPPPERSYGASYALPPTAPPSAPRPASHPPAKVLQSHIQPLHQSPPLPAAQAGRWEPPLSTSPRGVPAYEQVPDEMGLTRGYHGQESSGETVRPAPPGQEPARGSVGEDGYPTELTPLLPGGLRLSRYRGQPAQHGEEDEEDEGSRHVRRMQEEADEGSANGEEEDEEPTPQTYDMPRERIPLVPPPPPPRPRTPEPLTIAPDTPDVPVLLPNGNTKLVFRVVNPNPSPVVFKVMTTQPRVYSVRPNFGHIPAQGTIDLEVHAPADLVLRRRQQQPSQTQAQAQARGDRFAVLSRFVHPHEEDGLSEREEYASFFPSKKTTAEGIRSQRFRIRPLLVAQPQTQAGSVSGSTAVGSGGPFSPAQRGPPSVSASSIGALSPAYTAAPLPSSSASASGRPRSPQMLRFANPAATALGAGVGVGAMASLAGVAGQFAQEAAAEKRDQQLQQTLGLVRADVGEVSAKLDEVLRRMKEEEDVLAKARRVDEMPAEMELSYPEYLTPGKKKAGVQPHQVMALAVGVFLATYCGRVLNVI